MIRKAAAGDGQLKIRSFTGRKHIKSHRQHGHSFGLILHRYDGEFHNTLADLLIIDAEEGGAVALLCCAVGKPGGIKAQHKIAGAQVGIFFQTHLNGQLIQIGIVLMIQINGRCLFIIGRVPKKDKYTAPARLWLMSVILSAKNAPWVTSSTSNSSGS